MLKIPKVAAVIAAVSLLQACREASGPAPTYTLGGTVAALSGSGLVLQNNGGSDLTVAVNATAFSFPGSVSSGSAYNVSVRTQPTAPSQNCTVANATGTANANVANVAITCTTSTYTVGGTISGLTGSGLALRLNGGTALSVTTGSANFVFPAVASGTSYTVTVGTQPSNPAQNCTVTNGAGTVGAANITTVAVNCVLAAITVGGTVTGLASSGLALRLNGGAAIAIATGATSFTFPNSFNSGDNYRVTLSGQPATPAQTCTLVRGQGRVASASVTNLAVQCTTNATSPLSGTYGFPDGAGLRYITFWADGTYTFVTRENNPGCGPSNGNGIEYGVYNWNEATKAFAILTAAVDGNGNCGLSEPSKPLPTFRLVKSGSTLTITTPDGAFDLTAVASTPSTIVGSFGRDDGNDGSFVMFKNDGTYLVVDAQAGTGNGVLAGFERGCYTVSGSAIMTNLSAACRPDGLSALDLNGTGRFSDVLPTPHPFVVTAPNSFLLDGSVTFIRLLPN